jgi:hypothetical protein
METLYHIPEERELLPGDEKGRIQAAFGISNDDNKEEATGERKPSHQTSSYFKNIISQPDVNH